jgi:hypothetical protein
MQIRREIIFATIPSGKKSKDQSDVVYQRVISLMGDRLLLQRVGRKMHWKGGMQPARRG